MNDSIFASRIVPFTKEIWYRAINGASPLKIQCDEFGVPTNRFLLTPSHGEGFAFNLTREEAAQELGARILRMLDRNLSELDE